MFRLPIIAALFVLAAGASHAGEIDLSKGIPAYYSGFENARKEWSFFPLDKFIKPGEKPAPELNEAWTIQKKIVFAGEYAYKGWVIRAGPKHRAYPCHLRNATELVRWIP